MECSTDSQCRAGVLVPEPHCFCLKPLLLALSLEISMASQMLLCVCVPLIMSISLIVGMFHPSMLGNISIHILMQKIADLLWEDELSGLGTVITYSYHSTVSGIHPVVIPDQSTTSSKKTQNPKKPPNQEGGLIWSLISI